MRNVESKKRIKKVMREITDAWKPKKNTTCKKSK